MMTQAHSQNLIVIDLEATCAESDQSPSSSEMEIIEIGAVRLDANLEPSDDTFEAFVRPVNFPKLTDFCKSLTHIEQTQVDEANTLSDVVVEFSHWLGESPVLLGWGMWDHEQLIREVPSSLFDFRAVEYINLKREFYRLRKMREGSLKAAIDRAGLSFIGTPHRALSDAITTAQLAPLSGLAEYDPLWQQLCEWSGRSALQLRPWLRAPHPKLGGKTPMHVILNPEGRVKLKALFEAIDGIF
jgi:inhibitor of KinA sporulation pathway (predicted exonuclease)